MALSIAFAQVSPTVGDLPGNAELVRRARDNAAALGADLVVFPELVLVGYPPEDLVLRPALYRSPTCTVASARAVARLSAIWNSLASGFSTPSSCELTNTSMC